MSKTEEPARKPSVVILIYPGVTLQDMAGPQTLWAPHADTYLVWEKKGPVLTDGNISIVASHDFDDCPEHVDILCVPGGFGTWDLIGNEAVLAFLRRIGASARYVTSVCTGSITLAAAGLLDGRRAATHWATYGLLEALGVEGVRERVVVDGNRITGGGVTAGIDFGLSMLAELLGEEVAKATQLLAEYDPAPPFDCGSPERAGPEVTGAVWDMLRDDVENKGMGAVRALLERRQAMA